jgi:hypothetical protein
LRPTGVRLATTNRVLLTAQSDVNNWRCAQNPNASNVYVHARPRDGWLLGEAFGHRSPHLSSYQNNWNSPVEAAHPSTATTVITGDLTTPVGARTTVNAPATTNVDWSASEPFQGTQSDYWTQPEPLMTGDAKAALDYGYAVAGHAWDYTLCWAHNPDRLADYVVELGTLSVAGPWNSTSMVCILGLTCETTTTGFLLSTSNGMIVAGTDGCDDTTYGTTSAADSWGVTSAGNSWDRRRHGRKAFRELGVGKRQGGEAEGATEGGTGPADGDGRRRSYVRNDGARIVDADEWDVVLRSGGAGGLPFTADMLSSRHNAEAKAVSVSAAPGTAGLDTGARTTIHENTETFHFLPVAGEPSLSYQLCWGPEYGAAEGYLVGAMLPHVELWGPVTKDLVCTLGVNCTFHLQGVMQSVLNSVVVHRDYYARRRNSRRECWYTGEARKVSSNPPATYAQTRQTFSPVYGRASLASWHDADMRADMDPVGYSYVDHSTEELPQLVGGPATVACSLDTELEHPCVAPLSADGGLDGNTGCAASACRGHCDAHPGCTHYFTNPEGDCRLHRGCDTTRETPGADDDAASVGGFTYKKGSHSRWTNGALYADPGCNPTAMDGSTDASNPTATCAYSFGTPTSNPGRYSLCWAYDTAHTQYTHHMVRVGKFEMVGPETALDVACTLGLRCGFTLHGYGITADMQLVTAANYS